MAEFFVLFYLVARRRKPMRFDETARPVPCCFIMPSEVLKFEGVQIVLKGLNMPPLLILIGLIYLPNKSNLNCYPNSDGPVAHNKDSEY